MVVDALYFIVFYTEYLVEFNHAVDCDDEFLGWVAFKDGEPRIL